MEAIKIIHGVSRDKIAMIEQATAKLTKDGWIIPSWVALLAETCCR